MRTTCPCCGERDSSELLAFHSIPPSGHFRAAAADPIASIDLRFALCRTCGLVSQEKRDRLPDYSEVDRSTAQQLPDYTDRLLSELRAHGVGADDLIFELGSNDGTFLRALHGAGFRNLVGVEPSETLAERARRDGFRIVNDYFGTRVAQSLTERYGQSKVVVCRHTLEHVPEPDVFATAIRGCVDEQTGLVLLEVPDGGAIPELMNTYELWDEHLYYFVLENLQLLLARSRLAVERSAVFPHLDTRNLVVWCRPTTSKVATPPSPDRRWAQRWLAFSDAWQRYREVFSATLQAAPRPVYFVGASHSQSNLINFTEVGKFVDFLIDDDPAKVGRFAPIKAGNAPIIGTSEFERLAASGTVVLSGFGYPKWMNRIRAHANKVGLVVVDPYSFVKAEHDQFYHSTYDQARS